MNWLPIFEITWLGGWIYFIVYAMVFFITLGSCSKEVRRRLYDRSLLDRRTIILATIGNSFWLGNIVLIVFGKLTIGSLEFILGTVIFIIGLVLLEISVLSFRNKPLDTPITKGIYTISRHPQMISLYLLFLGMILVVGTWIGLGFLLVTIIFSHFTILAEEDILKRQYGESYIQYCKKVPRYFLFSLSHPQ